MPCLGERERAPVLTTALATKHSRAVGRAGEWLPRIRCPTVVSAQRALPRQGNRQPAADPASDFGQRMHRIREPNVGVRRDLLQIL